MRALYARLVRQVEGLAVDAAQRHGQPEPTSERFDEFFRHGMWLNVAAAMGVEDLSVGCDWAPGRGRSLGTRALIRATALTG